MPDSFRILLRAGWIASASGALGVRLWNALTGPLIYGYDVWGHLSYVFFLDLYRSTPYADQGWSYFHPPLHYWLGWILAQAGNSEVLLRGLCLLGGAMSLGTAALAAWFTRIALPERPGLPLAAFTAIAFLPVHLYASPFPGNEMTATFIGSAAVTLLAWNESRARPLLRLDVVTGGVAGMALLTKFSGLVPLAAVAAALAWKGIRPGPAREARGRVGLRGLAILVPALLIAGPYYARNVSEFGTPFKLSRDYPIVAEIEDLQPRISRSIWDFVRVSPRLFVDSDPGSEHMMKSVWSSVYVNVWSDNFGASHLLALRKRPKGEPLGGGNPLRPVRGTKQSLATLLAAVGLIPTGLALAGAAAAMRGAWHRRGEGADAIAILLAGATLGSFVLFVWQVPIWSSMKATYLLTASVPFGYFVARGLGALARAPAGLRVTGIAGIVLMAVVCAPVFTTNLIFPTREDSIERPGVEVFFGERPAVRWPKGTIRSLERAMYTSPSRTPFSAGRVALAYAYASRFDDALRVLDQALITRPEPELLATRGALLAGQGRLDEAERDLRSALEGNPTLPPAWASLAYVLGRQGSPQAPEVQATARRMREWVPRGFPYGAGNGHVARPADSDRWMLEIDEERGLRFYRPPRGRTLP
ncbi:MAG: hypothetical protein HRU00_07540 [Myxococcales bacterium]|nr:hypothetical protein [Myxococcales bacterium]